MMTPFSINIRGRLLHYGRTAVMGIINATEDSFFAGSRSLDTREIEDKARLMVQQGADILDIGAYSSRPGAADIPADIESERLRMAIAAVRRAVGDDLPVSVDTFRANVARQAIEEFGADIINDISGGNLDPDMFDTVAALHCPYILMHMRGTPATMQSLTDGYGSSVAATVVGELSHKVDILRQKGVADIIVDPGFGFAKTLEQNYQLLRRLELFNLLACPVLVGVSRKSMITRLLDITPQEAETPTAVLGALAIERGASILRVHDVLPAVQSVKLIQELYR